LYNRVNAELDDEAFALLATPLRTGSFEFLCRATLGAPTLAIALDRAVRFLRLLAPDLTVRIVRGTETATLLIAEVRPLAERRDDPGRIFVFEWLLRLLHGLSCWLVGRGIALDTVAFPYARPAHADDYALIYTERSFFESEHLAAEFRANLLDLPIRRDEPALAAFLDGAPGKISMLYRRDREMVLRVRDRLRTSLASNPGLEEIAVQLHLSPRTLHRRLAEEGTNFRAIKEALRRDLALARMAKTELPVADVATELGYADTSAFYRAFVDWTGQSPAHYRRRLSSPR
jgi:AraC-like DNA-binding protein